MGKSLLFKTNIAVCAIIAVGFAIISAIGYRADIQRFEEDVEHIALLASEGIYHQIDAIFTKPVNVSLTMANDTLLKSFLRQEIARFDDPAYVEEMREYLDSYRQKYGYDSVFLASTQTNRYYHFNGIDRVLTPDNPENVWFYDFVSSQIEYALNIDNDEASDDEITVFINCSITDEDGGVMGVVGVGFRVDEIQWLLLEYLREFGVDAYLLGADGTIELAPDRSGYQRENFFDGGKYMGMREQVIQPSRTDGPYAFWHPEKHNAVFVVTRYIPTLSWYLVLENDMEEFEASLREQFAQEITIIVVVTFLLLLLITRVIRQKRKEERMRDQMQRDPMTGLYNKVATQEISRRLLEENPDRQFAFFILDIDNFKQVNDQCGHTVGDEAIVRFATLLFSRFRDSDIVGRIGGDEFAVFLAVPDRGWVERKAADLVSALHTVSTSGWYTYKLSASIGIALSPDDGTTFEALYKKADAALYEVKQRGRNGFQIYNGA